MGLSQSRKVFDIERQILWRRRRRFLVRLGIAGYFAGMSGVLLWALAASMGWL